VMKELATAPEVPDAQNPMGLELNDGQWDFIFKYYPEYGAAPYAMLSWIYTQALEHENQYAKPSAIGGRVTGEDSDDQHAPEKNYKKYDGLNQGPKKKNKAEQKKADEDRAKK
jgi:hypothetical protein